MSYSILELISYFGGFMGMILFIVILATSKKSKAIKYSLASLLIVWSTTILFGALIYSGKVIHIIHIFRLDSPLHFLLGPTIYLFTLSSLNPNFNYKKIYLLHLIPFLINFIYFLPFYINSSGYKLNHYLNLTADETVLMPMQYLLKATSLISYLLAQIFLFKKYHIKNLPNSKSNHYQISWFVIYFGSQFILTTAGLIEYFTDLSFFGNSYRFVINMITFFLYCIMIELLFFPRLLYGNTTIEKEIKEKYSRSKLSNEVKETILKQLNDFMKESKKPFLDENFSLVEVSKILKISSQQLSQVINEKTHLNFNDFVNAHRIEEAKIMLLSISYSKLTIDAIAQKSGFHSRSAFYAAFKKHSGTTPKEFIAKADKEISQIILTR